MHWDTVLQAARQMRGSGSGNVAVVVPTITNNFLLIWLIQSKEHAANMHTGR